MTYEVKPSKLGHTGLVFVRDHSSSVFILFERFVASTTLKQFRNSVAYTQYLLTF